MNCVDYRKDSLQNDYYDIIFDAAGKSSFWKCRSSLKRTGLYITTQINIPTLLQHLCYFQCSRKRARTALSMNKQNELEVVLALLASGQLKTHIDRVFPLNQAEQAHAYVEQSKKRGNVVVNIWDDVGKEN